jgi:hypothetical protein
MRATTIAAPSAHEVIRYDCERCKREFVLGDRHRLSPMDWLGAHMSGGSDFEAERRRRLAQADERASEAFVASFRFCHECRRFVCPKCWSRSWKTCRACVGRAYAKLPVARRRFRLGTSMIVIASAMLLLVLGVGEVLAISNTGPGAPGSLDRKSVV